MEYTIIFNGEVFYTKWYDYVNHYAEGMIVINNLSHKYTNDGINWILITEDSL